MTKANQMGSRTNSEKQQDYLMTATPGGSSRRRQSVQKRGTWARVGQGRGHVRGVGERGQEGGAAGTRAPSPAGVTGLLQKATVEIHPHTSAVNHPTPHPQFLFSSSSLPFLLRFPALQPLLTPSLSYPLSLRGRESGRAGGRGRQKEALPVGGKSPPPVKEIVGERIKLKEE